MMYSLVTQVKISLPLLMSLARSLVSYKLKVWYDEFTLEVGDSLTEKINHGLANSEFGIVIVSKNFFRKNWPKEE